MTTDILSCRKRKKTQPFSNFEMCFLLASGLFRKQSRVPECILTSFLLYTSPFRPPQPLKSPVVVPLFGAYIVKKTGAPRRISRCLAKALSPWRRSHTHTHAREERKKRSCKMIESDRHRVSALLPMLSSLPSLTRSKGEEYAPL